MTEWRDIPSLPGYQASDEGQIRSVPRVDRIGRAWRGRVRKLSNGYHGYLVIGIWSSDHNGCVPRPVHRLVCEAFHGVAPEDRPYATHKDGNRKNNHADNLRWGTPSENTEDARRHGTMVVGEASVHAKLSDEAVRQIRSVRVPDSLYAKRFGVDRRIVCAVRLRQAWKHVE